MAVFIQWMKWSSSEQTDTLSHGHSQSVTRWKFIHLLHFLHDHHLNCKINIITIC